MAKPRPNRTALINIFASPEKTQPHNTGGRARFQEKCRADPISGPLRQSIFSPTWANNQSPSCFLSTKLPTGTRPQSDCWQKHNRRAEVVTGPLLGKVTYVISGRAGCATHKHCEPSPETAESGQKRPLIRPLLCSCGFGQPNWRMKPMLLSANKEPAPARSRARRSAGLVSRQGGCQRVSSAREQVGNGRRFGSGMLRSATEKRY
jgi:hypothetical protein